MGSNYDYKDSTGKVHPFLGGWTPEVTEALVRLSKEEGERLARAEVKRLLASDNPALTLADLTDMHPCDAVWMLDSSGYMELMTAQAARFHVRMLAGSETCDVTFHAFNPSVYEVTKHEESQD